MNKIICILLSVLLMGTGAFAQDKMAKTPKQRPTKTSTASTAAVAPTPPQEGSKPTKMKKDGTPDMRYSENKKKAAPAGPLKKDGTPDMRHKANKDAAATKK